MRIAYLVSRFPTVTETFIVREMDGLAALGTEIDLLSLFPGDPDAVHRRIQPWLERHRRPRPLAALADLTWWLPRRPLRVLSSLGMVVAGHARSPKVLLKSLATIPLAAAHARHLHRRAADGLGVEHVHAHWATYPALAAWLCHRLTEVPYSFTAHAQDIYVDRSFLERKARDARLVVTISDYNRRLLEPVADGTTPVEIVRYGLEMERYPFRARAPLPEGPVRMLCTASLRDYKGHAVLLQALACEPEALRRVELMLAGDGPLRGELERQTRSLGVAGRVHFLGSRSEDEVVELLQSSELFVLPSIVLDNGWQEGLPVALIEALAVGVPTVTTRMSGTPELVRHGETGLLAEPGDAQGLADALIAVLADPEAAARRAQAGRRLVEEEFDVRRSAQRLSELFRVTPRRGPSQPRSAPGP